MAAEVLTFPREGFVIDHNGHCMHVGPERHLMCFQPRGHDGDHEWSAWAGCKIRTKLPSGKVIVLPFGGFAN